MMTIAIPLRHEGRGILAQKSDEIYKKKHTFKYNIKNSEAIFIQLRNLISNKTKIDKKVIYNLLKIERIQNISNITIKNKKSDRIIEVPDNIILKENYQLHTDYIFANFNVFNNHYEITKDFYTNKLNKKISLHSSKCNLIINSGRSYISMLKGKSGLYLKFCISKQDLSYSDIKYLNTKEKEQLNIKLIHSLNSINNIKNIKNIITPSYYKEGYKFEVNLESDLNITPDKINSIIDQEIKLITEGIYYVINKIKLNNKDVFERALLEQEMTNF